MSLQAEYSEMVSSKAKPGVKILDSLSGADCNLWHMATGVSTEAGELLDAVKKVVIYQKPADIENIIEELGDLEFYMEGIRRHFLINRETVLEANMAKLGVRYPNGYTDEEAQARNDKS